MDMDFIDLRLDLQVNNLRLDLPDCDLPPSLVMTSQETVVYVASGQSSTEASPLLPTARYAIVTTSHRSHSMSSNLCFWN